ncbi:FAD-dependent oxidoreductase, partial [Pseudomonas cedrina]
MQEPHKNLRDVSFWFSELIDRKDLAWPTMVQQTEDIHADVCIVGAGYSGLWTAYELLSASPELNVVIIDAKYPGYGASGRNGGAVIPRINGS